MALEYLSVLIRNAIGEKRVARAEEIEKGMLKLNLRTWTLLEQCAQHLTIEIRRKILSQNDFIWHTATGNNSLFLV